MTIDEVALATGDDPERRRWATAPSFRLPDPDDMLSDTALAELLGWAGAKTVANRRSSGRSVPDSVRINRVHYSPGSAVREWLLGGGAAEATGAARCDVCHRRFATSRGLTTHRRRVGHHPEPSPNPS